MVGDKYVCIDRNLTEVTNRFDLQADAITAGTAALLLVEDDSFAVCLMRSGIPKGATPEPNGSIPDWAWQWTWDGYVPPGQVIPTWWFDSWPWIGRRFRLIKLGELRFFNDVVTYTALAIPDGLKRVDTDLP